MKKKYYLFSISKSVINIYPLILIALGAAILYLIYQDNALQIISDYLIISIILFIPYCFLHEIFHGISYVIHGAKFRNVTYGIVFEKGVMCCLCKQNISKKSILISLLYPFIFLGIVTLVIGIIFNLPILVILSLLNISGCSGDLSMFYSL